MSTFFLVLFLCPYVFLKLMLKYLLFDQPAVARTLLGNSTNIWIFQIAGSLTMANGTAVILVQGAQAANVVWQVAGHRGLGSE